tara:strand:+ start:38497 stop:39054 length:558 start_codon:yes stop_codon:yes gene_type:complete
MKNYILPFLFLFSVRLIAQTSSPDCVDNSFKPIPGEKYVVSAWVKDDISTQVTSYDGYIKIVNTHDASETINDFYASGNIIDGWQRIIGEFTMHENSSSLNIKLISKENGTSFFDDIRFFPFNSNMKSFVYDPVNLRLMAELDENNFATFYEYDNEGGLVRVKKETEKGIYTIQETRSSSSKINN